MEFMRLSCTPSQSIPLGGNSWSYFIMGGAVWQCGGKLTVTLLRRSSSNLNQITKRVNETSRIYAVDIECLLENQEKLWFAAKEILVRLSNLR